MIRFACPTCKAALQAPAQTAGDKVACPKCGQRVLIPNPVKPAASNLPPIQAQHKPSTSQPEPSLPICPKEVQDMERKPFVEKRRKRRAGGTRPGSGCFMVIAFLLIAVGCITLAYWVNYDTTVSSYDTTTIAGYSRTHNLGLMNNRVVGTIVGVGMVLGGLIVFLGSEMLDSITRLTHLLDREDDEI
ncbi:MAG: TFIIB-type zinc ribbon-containing protein [Gemmataceae bacterium]